MSQSITYINNKTTLEWPIKTKKMKSVLKQQNNKKKQLDSEMTTRSLKVSKKYQKLHVQL